MAFNGTRDVPTDWFSRFGDEITETLYLQEKWERLPYYREDSLSRAWQDTPYDLKSTSSCPPIDSDNALHFYNNPAICYMFNPPWDPKNYKKCGRGYNRAIVYTQPSYVWLREAYKHWAKTGNQYDVCDGKGVFHTVFLRPEGFPRFADWSGLGIKSCLEPEEARKAREEDLAALVMQHEQLCDLVYERSLRPCEFKCPSTYLNTLLKEYTGVDPVMSPICRAVLLIATCDMTDEKRILVVLTGDNGALMGPAPSLDSIPKERIFTHLGDNAVEVPLKTAVDFLRHLDDEEERVNDVLRNTTRTRIQKVDKMIHEYAVEEVGEWNKKGIKTIRATTLWIGGFQEALGRVLDRHGE